MQNIIIYGSVAKTDQIKSLTDVERKVIKIISDSFREGKASIEVDDTTYSGIKEKLKTEPATRKPTPFLEKMLKVFQNFFSDRISSESLQKEIQNALHTTEPLIQKEIQIIQKQQQRHDQIQSDLKNAQQKLSKLDPQKNQTEINELKGEIRRLYQEKANLDIVQIPKELRSQVEKFTNKMAHICEDVKTDTLTHYYKELQDAIGDQFKENQSNHGELSSQFTKDYVNRNIANFVLVDRDKNIYLENAKIGTSKEEKKETYLKKFNGLL